jgi:hypothetical protein
MRVPSSLSAASLVHLSLSLPTALSQGPRNPLTHNTNGHEHDHRVKWNVDSAKAVHRAMASGNFANVPFSKTRPTYAFVNVYSNLSPYPGPDKWAIAPYGLCALRLKPKYAQVTTVAAGEFAPGQLRTTVGLAASPRADPTPPFHAVGIQKTRRHLVAVSPATMGGGAAFRLSPVTTDSSPATLHLNLCVEKAVACKRPLLRRTGRMTGR